MTSDERQLLREFVEDHSQSAFTELVQRHLNLVYSAALRQVATPQAAEDVAQSVFLDLARNAHRLKADTVLSAWLYQVTRRTAIDLVRRESSRQRREQTAMQMLAIHTQEDNWAALAPLLDEAMHALSENDRTAILLRYFENKSLREVGQAIASSEDAAQKRISRALEQLRSFFAKRGLSVSSSALGIALSTHAIQAAPVTVSALALAAHGATVGSTLATKTVLTTLLPKVAVLVIVTGAVTFGWMQHCEISALRNQAGALRARETFLVQQLETQSQEQESASPAPVLASKDLAELARLRAEVTTLRQATWTAAAIESANTFAAAIRPIVADITVRNVEPKALSDEEIRAKIRTQVGDVFERVAVDRDVRELYATRLFDSIRVAENTNEAGIALTYVVREK